MIKRLAFLLGVFVHVNAWNRVRPSLRMSTVTPNSAKVSSIGSIISLKNIARLSSAATVGALVVGATASTPLIAMAEEDNSKTDDATFITTESGLKYRDLKVGEGDAPVPGDIVRVHYTGWLDGFDSEKKFDSSYDRRSPLSFAVGTRKVIAGWDEGILTNLKVGGKRELIIPASLGYGSRGAGGVIPPNATLYFRIELVGIGAKANR